MVLYHGVPASLSHGAQAKAGEGRGCRETAGIKRERIVEGCTTIAGWKQRRRQVCRVVAQGRFIRLVEECSEIERQFESGRRCHVEGVLAF